MSCHKCVFGRDNGVPTFFFIRCIFLLYCRGQPSKTDSRRFLVVPLVHRFSVPVFFACFLHPAAGMLTVEPNYNMLQKHTVNGNKKGLPRETFHAMAIAAWIPRR